MNYTRPETYVRALRGLGAPKAAAERIAKSYPKGHGLHGATPRMIAAAAGIDADAKIPAWVPRIGAAFSLASATATTRANDSAVRTPTDVVERIRRAISGETQECFIVVYLDARCREIDAVIVHRGTLSSVEVHPRDVFAPALQCGAHTIIIGHNHPSGDPSPSEADIDLTKRLVDTGSLMGIQVLDHIVVGASSFSSLATLGLIS